MSDIRHRKLKSIGTRLAFWPGLLFCRALASLGVWRTWHKVDENLIIGAYPSLSELQQLHDLGVRKVIDLCAEHSRDAAAAKRTGMTLVPLPCLDFHAPPREQILRALSEIRAEADRGHPTYVHCKAGRLRSAIIAMAYLILCKGMSPDNAARHLRAIRPQVDGRLGERVDWEQFRRDARSDGQHV